MEKVHARMDDVHASDEGMYTLAMYTLAMYTLAMYTLAMYTLAMRCT